MKEIDALIAKAFNETVEYFETNDPCDFINWDNLQNEVAEAADSVVRELLPQFPTREWVMARIRERPDLLDPFLRGICNGVAMVIHEANRDQVDDLTNRLIAERGAGTQRKAM